MNIYCCDAVLSSGGRQLCEDRILVTPQVAAVIDGATQVVPDAPLPSPSEGTWIADLVVQTLAATGAVAEGPHSMLLALSRRIDSELASLHWPDDRVPPVCSIGLAIAKEKHLEVATLGDVSVIYTDGGRIMRIFNDRFLQNERNAFTTGDLTSDGSEKSKVDGILERRRGYIRGFGGAGVLSRYPAAVDSVIHLQLCPLPGDLILIATDGFMRLLDLYGIVTSTEDLLGRSRRPGGLGELLAALRAYEYNCGPHAGARKGSDDAAAVLLEVSP